jgi:hypothetical protein
LILKLEKGTKWTQNVPNEHKMYQMNAKYTKWTQNIPNEHKMYQMNTKCTKWTQNVPNETKCTKWTQNVPKGHKFSQLVKKYSNWPWHFPISGSPEFTRIGIFGLKRNHLATLVHTLVGILVFMLSKSIFECEVLYPSMNLLFKVCNFYLDRDSGWGQFLKIETRSSYKFERSPTSRPVRLRKAFKKYFHLPNNPA